MVYRLKGNLVEQPRRIGTLIYDDLGKLVIAKLNERFRGFSLIEYPTKPIKNSPICFANFLRVLAIDEILAEEAYASIRVINPFDLVRHINIIPDQLETAAYTNAVAIFPNKGPNERKKQQVLALLGKKKHIKRPLIVVGLGIEIDDKDPQGFRFKATDYTEVREAPWLLSLSSSPSSRKKVEYDISKADLITSYEGGVRVTTNYDNVIYVEKIGNLIGSRCIFDLRGLATIERHGLNRHDLGRFPDFYNYCSIIYIGGYRGSLLAEPGSYDRITYIGYDNSVV